MKQEREPVELDVPGEDTETTSEVGSEGGTPGDVEVASAPAPASGSEATETKRPEPAEDVEVRRDETGRGRRSP